MSTGMRLLLNAVWSLGLSALIVHAFGCVRSITVCTTYDHQLGRENENRYARDSAGASVCADVSPPGAPVRK